MNTPFKRTKILATLGPATSTPEKISELIAAGANGIRLNFSHGTYDERLEQIPAIRKASEQAGRPVAILQDLQGPKIRLGELKNNRQDVKKGDILTLDHAAEHNVMILPVQYNLAQKVKVGEPVYLFDGKVRTTVIEIPSDTAIKVRVENDGFLMSKKGLNLPDTDFGGDILTQKDMSDIDFGADKDIDYVALSFIQSDDDINNLRDILTSKGSKAKIIAKVETKAAIKDEMLEKIVKASDGVMVARGDLAVEVGAEMVPIIQRKIIALCRKYGKISIVATQMMASMVDAPEPTRAEVSDVATAVILGADAVMLSDETANGNYPIEAVGAMRKTILYTQDNWDVIPEEPKNFTPLTTNRHAISQAAVEIAKDVEANAIVAETKSGATASNVASCRPCLPIVAVTSNQYVAQQLALTYGTRAFVRPDDEEAGIKVAKELLDSKILFDSDEILAVIVSGNQPGVTGGTDTIRVRRIS